MQFKNLTLLHVKNPDLNSLEEQLAKYQFTPCLGSSARSEGFSKLKVNDQFTFVANNRALLNYTIETKSVPASALKLKLQEACARFAEDKGYSPGKKAKKELREDLFDQLMASALPSRKEIQIVISAKGGTIYLDTASTSVADAIVKALFKVTELEFTYGRTNLTASAEMLARLLETDEDDAEHLFNFDLNNAAETMSRDETGTVVKYKNLNLTTSEVVSTLQKGTRDVIKLALTWRDLIAFTLTSDVQLKGIKYLDSFKSEISSGDVDKDDFGSTFYLYMTLMDDMISELFENLGGLAEEK